MPLPVRHLPVVQQWDCHSCGNCCREYQVPVTREERERLEAFDWSDEPLLAGRPLFLRRGLPWARRYVLNHNVDHCVFLTTEGRCRIHERFGMDAKPLACRMFPFVLLPAGDHWRLGMRYACPSVAGNVGRPLASLPGEVDPAATIVCECSSFQLEDSRAFAPEVAVLLNVTPDHLDRHGTLAAYAEAKLRIFSNQTAEDTAIVDADDPSRVIALACGSGVSLGDVPPGFQRIENPVAPLEDSPALPPLCDVFGIALGAQGERRIERVVPAIASPHAALHLGAIAIALEAASMDALERATGSRDFQVEQWTMMMLKPGFEGPFVARANVVPARGGRVGVEAMMVDEGAKGRIMATASAAFRRVGT